MPVEYRTSGAERQYSRGDSGGGAVFSVVPLECGQLFLYQMCID